MRVARQGAEFFSFAAGKVQRSKRCAIFGAILAIWAVCMFTPGQAFAVSWHSPHQAGILAGTSAAECFGYSLGITSDGATAVVGAPCANSYNGRAYVFWLNDDGQWVQTAELTPPSSAATYGEFGSSVAISRDGSTLAVVADYVYAYTKQADGDWALSATLGSEPFGLGAELALSKNGSTLLVSEWMLNKDTGAAYIFTKKHGKWSQGATLTASDGVANDCFGLDGIALSEDGATAVIGSPHRNSDAGAAYVFANSGGTWKQTAELEVAGTGWLGTGAAISGDGKTIALGSPYSFPPTSYVYTNSSGEWGQPTQVTISDSVYGYADGHSLALSKNGTVLAIGGLGRGEEIEGAVGMFVVDESGTWQQQALLTVVPDLPLAGFGDPVAISDNGLTIIGGAMAETNAFPSGAAIVFTD
jgi:hypothetical protein